MGKSFLHGESNLDFPDTPGADERQGLTNDSVTWKAVSCQPPPTADSNRENRQTSPKIRIQKPIDRMFSEWVYCEAAKFSIRSPCRDEWGFCPVRAL